MRRYLLVVGAVLAASPCAAQSDSNAMVRRSSFYYQAASEDSKVERGALLGLGIGAVVGLLVDAGRDLVAAAPDVCVPATCTGQGTTLSPPFGTSILIGAGTGLVIGAIIGKRAGNQYVEITPDARRGTVALAARIKW